MRVSSVTLNAVQIAEQVIRAGRYGPWPGWGCAAASNASMTRVE
jgi:hypothetical protein